jgi:hypothetical protein
MSCSTDGSSKAASNRLTEGLASESPSMEVAVGLRRLLPGHWRFEGSDQYVEATAVTVVAMLVRVYMLVLVGSNGIRAVAEHPPAAQRPLFRDRPYSRSIARAALATSASIHCGIGLSKAWRRTTP